MSSIGGTYQFFYEVRKQRHRLQQNGDWIRHEMQSYPPGKDLIMKHTPYGYDIVGGAALINKEQADAIRQTCENYLSGMSMTQAAKDVGLEMKHSGVKRLMQNPRYLGDDFYPAILTPEIVRAVEAERLRRDALYQGKRYTRDDVEISIPTSFTMRKLSTRYKDPIKHAEYAYSLIEAVENTESKAK